MSTIHRDKNKRPIEPHVLLNDDGLCNICGDVADGIWHPTTRFAPVAVCHHCAITVLPCLIADAMRAKGRGPDVLFKTRDKMLERFYYAAALALANNTPGVDGEKDE